MSAGTITLTNNSAAVSGTGTVFTTDLKAGDFIVSVVGGVTYTLPVKTVNSATSVTLLKNYDGPTQAGAAWSSVPRDAMNAITAQLAAETAQALRGLNYDKQNWQLVFSSNGNITIRLPDGSTFSGPSWNSLSNQLSNLGSASTANIQQSVGDAAKGRVMINGAHGLGGPSLNDAWSNSYQRSTIMTSAIDGAESSGTMGIQIAHAVNPAEFKLQIAGRGSRLYFRGSESSVFEAWRKIYHTGNTTVASDGTLKTASPIVNIFHDGTFDTNDESEGAQVSREDVGVYRISNVLGMNSDRAWGGNDGGFEIPKDRNGQRLIWLDYEVEADGSILVKTYHRTYPDAPIFARNIKDGYEESDPIDIPSDQFLSVRVEMPQDSIWNLAQKAAQEEMAQEEIAED
ncbi:phage tail protein [Hafnia alvei]|uniref:phage tail fiber protein n=1 Tax=Hafnia alvei TaxID=569 RepID=UPI00345D1169